MRIEDILKTEESKLNFLKGIIRVSKCDGILAKEEQMYMNQIAIGFNFSEASKDILKKCYESDETISVNFDTKREKNFFLMQSIQLSWIDGNYSDEEKIETRKIASELGVEEEKVIKIEAWVQEGVEWNKRGDLLVDM